jgi:hypothetical protein
VTGYGIGSRKEQDTSFPSQSPDRVLLSLVPSGNRDTFLPGINNRSVKLITHFDLIIMQKIVETYLDSHIRLHGLMLN